MIWLVWRHQVEAVSFAWHNDTVVGNESVLDGLSIAVGRERHSCSSRRLKCSAIGMKAGEILWGSVDFSWLWRRGDIAMTVDFRLEGEGVRLGLYSYPYKRINYIKTKQTLLSFGIQRDRRKHLTRQWSWTSTTGHFFGMWLDWGLHKSCWVSERDSVALVTHFYVRY